MPATLLETLILPAQIGLRFLDAYSGDGIGEGLRCTLYRRRDSRLLGIAVATPSGVHHWPELAAAWREAPIPPSSPPGAALAEVLVEDLMERYLPVRLPWPPVPDSNGPHWATITLASAPQRHAPSGAATVYALLTTADDTPAAWARVLVTDAQARSHVGMSDAAGRLTLHLPFPRPDRRTVKSPPESPPVAPAVSADVTLRVFHAADLGVEASAAAQHRLPAIDAPLLPDWAVQPEFRALARIGMTDAFGPLRLEPDRPSLPVTAGLPPDRSELRLAPL